MIKSGKILLDHGSGGLATRQLIEDIFLKHLTNPLLSRMEDSAILNLPQGRIAFTTDSFVIDPIFFPGGDIGSLSIHGTVNDLAMQGASPAYLSLGLIIEEGLEIKTLENIAASIGQAATRAGVQIATADTKVVGQGQADKIFINTSGVGIVPEGVTLGTDRARPGDIVIVSGSIGDHGAAILLARSGLPFQAEIKSDSAPLAALVKNVLKAADKKGVRLFRDPTRGGLATVLNEIAQASQVDIEIEEEKIPVRQEVETVCELLGLDPLYLANEGKCVAVVAKEEADRILKAMRQTDIGKEAQVIGRVCDAQNEPQVRLVTSVGGVRLVPMLSGEPLPRIC